MKEKYFIPRNIIDSDDIIPFDFIINFKLQKRQIPYILLGTAISTFAITSSGTLIPTILITKGIVSASNISNATYIAKGLITLLSMGTSYTLSDLKIKQQHFEDITKNTFKYAIEKYKFNKENKHEKNN